MSLDSFKPLPKFESPPVHLGDPVIWSHHRDDGESAAAMVIKIGNGGAIGLIVFAPDTARPLLMDGVLHADDPRNRARESDSGVWRHTERTQRINKLIALLGDHADFTDEALASFTNIPL